MIVVIPSCRSVDLDYLRPLIDAGSRFIVVDDSPGSIEITHKQFEVYAWPDQERMLGPLANAIPRRNGACRDFGFYLAWAESEPGEIIVALDDDCVVEDLDFALRVDANLRDASRPTVAGDGMHWNVLDLYQNIEPGVFPRGFPYAARAGYEPFTIGGAVRGAPAFHLGLWRGIFDVNAIDKLNGPAFAYDDATLTHESVVVPTGVLVSACSMSMAFRREVIPAVYQLPMHVEVMPNWVVDRYGDIWGGYVLKTLMDRRGDLMSVGAPMIRHVKDGNIQRNIWQEHACHLVNDEFVDVLLTSELSGGSYLAMMDALTEHLDAQRASCSSLLAAYVAQLVPALRAWTAALERRG
jgi:hypothetical protein